MKIDETIDKYKLRFVVKGFKQHKVWTILTCIHLVSRINFI